MEFIDLESLTKRLGDIAGHYRSRRPFHYTMFEGFFKPEAANAIYDSYPTIGDGKWDGTTYIDQKNKFQKTKFDSGSALERVFIEMNSAVFREWLEKVTGISGLIGDDELFGGGLHQSVTGAFLNVHVDYNVHPKTKLHRRLNVLVYLNKDWQDDYEGHLELWDLSDGRKEMLEKYAPTFNRCVIFETNEFSYHGHPKPLRTPPGVNRKSIATYYYTTEVPAGAPMDEHNTIYINTEGASGQFKRLSSGLKALRERLLKK